MRVPNFLGQRVQLVIATAFSLLLFTQCADSLDVTNENDPPIEVLQSEEGLRRLALGVWAFDNGQVIGDYNWIAQTLHSVMGDELVVPWGNFTWRWANQPTSITYNDGMTTWTPPQGADQGTQLESFNDRVQEDNNAYAFEWRAMYRANNTSNLILENVASVEFNSQGDLKRPSYEAWAHFWKGWAYSRLGSIYSSGLIINEAGVTNGDYVSNDELIAEAGREFDLAEAALTTLQANGEGENVWAAFVTAVIPDYMQVQNGSPTIADMIATLNTMRARNILVNRRAFDIGTGSMQEISDAEYQQVLDLTADGLGASSNWIQFRSNSSNGVFFQTIWPPYRVLIGWNFVSERLVQDFPDGDLRRERNVLERASAAVNTRGRGIQYGTRYDFNSIENGGDYASTEDGLATMPMAGSYAENALMRAEALIRTGSVDEGLALVDEVRTAQNSGLDATSGTGLDSDAAYEVLQAERRIGLIFQGLQFYDARRWGRTVPVSLGGGRENSVILDEGGDVFDDATINYNYLDYFGVPDDELDFNETDRASVASVSPS